MSLSLAGRWHLVAADCPEDQIPDHRADYVFYEEPSGLRGAILAHGDGSEIPLDSVGFDGRELRLRMASPPNRPIDLPFLVMTPVADRFEGVWDHPDARHLRLKLVRARK